MDWLRIHVSNLCNFKCPNCHVFELGENNLPNRVMSQEVFNQAVDQFLNVASLMGNKQTMISIYGGETMANKKVIKDGVLRYGQNCNGIKLQWVINTNGSLLKEEDILFFKKHNVELHVSVDGSEDIHNISRPTHKGKGTFHMVKPALELIKKHQAPAQINSYMMPSNYLNLHEIVDIAAEHGIKKIYLDQFYNLDMISHQVGMELYRKVFYYGIRKGVTISGPWGRVVKYGQNGKNKIAKLDKRLAIDVNMDGTFYFPLMSGTKKIHREIKDLTNLYEQGLWTSTIAEARDFYNKQCDGCSIKEKCFGSAIEQVHYHIGTDADPAVSCNFFRDWCNFLLRPVFLKQYEKLELISMIELEQVEPMIEKIQATIIDLEKRLWPLKNKIFVNIAGYPEELRFASGQHDLPEWVRATTSSGHTLHHLGTKLTPALVHELTHLFIAERGLKLPQWFVEGLCEWTQDQKIDLSFLQRSLQSLNLFERPEILSGKKQLIDLDKNLPEANGLYLQAKAFVAYLLDTLGEEQFARLMVLSEQCPLEEALLKLNVKTLEEYIYSFQALHKLSSSA